MNIFVLDDYKTDRETLASPFRAAHDVRTAADLEEAKRSLEDWWPDVALVDAIFPTRRADPPKFLAGAFLEFLESKRPLYPYMPQVIIVSGQRDAARRFDEVRQWLNYGRIADVMAKSTADIGPNFFNSVIQLRVEILLERQRWNRVQTAAESDSNWFLQLGIATRSPRVLSLRMALTAAAQSDSGVLVSGPTGSGKELFAEAIHKLARPGKPWIDINCAAIPIELFETEMFGIMGKGRDSSGVYFDKEGLLEAAKDGTVHFDEVHTLDLLKHQPKMLKVLQDRKFRRVGAVTDTPFRAKVIAATNTNLAELVQQGKFREDLYYRIKCFDLDVPGLHERSEDIPLLVDQFLSDLVQRRRGSARHCPEIRLNQKCLTPLLSYRWPGNVRELKSVVEKAAEFALLQCAGKDTAEIGPDLLSEHAPEIFRGSAGVVKPSSAHDIWLERAKLSVARWCDLTEGAVDEIRRTILQHLSPEGQSRFAAMELALQPRDPNAGENASGRESQYPELLHCLKGLLYLLVRADHRASVQDFAAVCQFKAWDPGKKVMQVLGAGDESARPAYEPFVALPAARARQEASLLPVVLAPRI